MMRGALGAPGRYVGAGLVLSFVSAVAGAQADSVVFSADTVRGFHGPTMPAERLTVRRRETVGGTTFEHSVVSLVVRATKPARRAPVVFLMGGPGVPASIIARIPPYFDLFARLRDDGDVVLMDQRGTGLSTPSIDCPETAPPDSGFLLSLERLTRAVARIYASCVGHWRGSGVPPEAYTPSAVSEDVERARVALGAERVSVLGMSYGTLLAIEYAQRFPGRVDRVALQGAMSREHGARRPVRLDSLLTRVAEAVGADSVGRSLSSDLRRDLGGVLQELDARPRPVRVANAAGDSVTIPVGGDGLRAIVTGRLGDPRLPALVGTLRDGDPRVLAQFVGSLYRDLAAGAGTLFGRTVYCAAPPSEGRLRVTRREAGGFLLGAVFDNAVYEREFCGGMSLRFERRDPARLAPLGRPGLIVAGTLDDRTPLGNTKDILPAFSPASLVVVENGGHELLVADDVRDVVARFLAGEPVGATRLRHARPRFDSVEEALRPPRR
jgi:pimeloyl-ACP methyl ester carboxylesterase